MTKFRWLKLSVTLVSMLSLSVAAEVLHLKDGRTIEGAIKGKDGDTIIVDMNGIEVQVEKQKVSDV